MKNNKTREELSFHYFIYIDKKRSLRHSYKTKTERKKIKQIDSGILTCLAVKYDYKSKYKIEQKI